MGRRTCTFNGCDKEHYAKGFCLSHYRRWRRYGLPSGQGREDAYRGKPCSVVGCERPAEARGMCRMHHHRWWKFGDPGEAAPRRAANGEGSTNTQGYRTIYVRDHPNARPNGRILEHVYVMSVILGRALRPGENVHHKNGQKTDNRPENLELWTRHQPVGRRVKDWLSWAVEEYPDELRMLLDGHDIQL